MSASLSIEQGIQNFWAGVGMAAPHEWPEALWPDRWVWTEELGGFASSGEMPCTAREEKYRSTFRMRSTGEGWTEQGRKEALRQRDTCIEALEADGITFGSTVDGIDHPIEYTKVTPINVVGPSGPVAYWEWTIDLTVLTSR